MKESIRMLQRLKPSFLAANDAEGLAFFSLCLTAGIGMTVAFKAREIAADPKSLILPLFMGGVFLIGMLLYQLFGHTDRATTTGRSCLFMLTMPLWGGFLAEGLYQEDASNAAMRVAYTQLCIQHHLAFDSFGTVEDLPTSSRRVFCSDPQGNLESYDVRAIVVDP